MLSALWPPLFTHHGTLFLSLREEHIWMFGKYFICACPTDALHQFLLTFVWKKHWFIELAAFLDINSEKNKFHLRGSVGLCPFLQHVRCVSPSLTEFPDGLKPSALGQTDESKASNEISAGVCLSGQNGIGELSGKEVFGLDSVSLLLMHKARALFRRPLTSLGRAKPVKQGLSEYLLSLTKRGACWSCLIIQDLGLARKNKRHPSDNVSVGFDKVNTHTNLSLPWYVITPFSHESLKCKLNVYGQALHWIIFINCESHVETICIKQSRELNTTCSLDLWPKSQANMFTLGP